MYLLIFYISKVYLSSSKKAKIKIDVKRYQKDIDKERFWI